MTTNFFLKKAGQQRFKEGDGMPFKAVVVPKRDPRSGMNGADPKGVFVNVYGKQVKCSTADKLTRKAKHCDAVLEYVQTAPITSETFARKVQYLSTVKKFRK